MAKKFARRELKRLPNGTMGIVFVDVKTGKVVTDSNIKKYTILSAGNDTELAIKESEEKSTAEEYIDELWKQFDGNNYDPGLLGTLGKADATNNFGYINKPDWMKALGFTKAGKALNIGIDLANITATNKARSYLGLAPLSSKDSIKSAIGREGYITDVDINGKQYAVGFEAFDKTGRTTLTPTEARNRSLTLGGIKEVSEDRVKEAQKEFNSEFKNPTNKFQDTMSKIPVVGKLFDSGYKTSLPDVKTTPTVDTPSAAVTKYAAKDTPALGAQGARDMAYQGREAAKGLAAYNPEQTLPNVSYNLGPKRSEQPNETSVVAVQRAVNQVFGKDYTVNVYSGKAKDNPLGIGRDKNNPSGRHDGRALDFSVNDPQGNKVTDRESLTNLASELGRQGLTSLGYGKGYMGIGNFHADTLKDEDYGPRQGPVWGGDTAIAKAFMAERTPVGILPENPMTPSARPNISIANMKDSITGQPVSPAQAAKMGYVERTSEERDAISFALAGELSPSQLSKIANGDPTAISEFANMVASIENRAGSGKYGTFGEVFSPSQYNSLKESELSNTEHNYNMYGEALRSLTDSFYDVNGIVPTDYSITNYHASYVNPSWSSSMKNSQTVGDHVFGVLDSRYDTPNPYSNSNFMSRSGSNQPASRGIGPTNGPSPSSPAGGAQAASGFSTGLGGNSPGPSTGPSPSSPAGGAQAASGYGPPSNAPSSGYDPGGGSTNDPDQSGPR